MYVMYRVGIATAIGLVIEVPILLRSLADSLAEVDIRHLPLRFHPSLLAALDDGVAADGPARLVGSYACDWWRQKTELALAPIFGMDTLEECLVHHRQYIAAPADSATAGQPPHNTLDAACPSCIKMRSLVHDMLDESRSTESFIDGCQSAADAAMNRNIRKAVGFHRLHELAMFKDLQAESKAESTILKNPGRMGGPSKQTAVATRSGLVAARAEAELQRLKSLPATKWTWGADITKNDVLASNQSTKSKGKKAKAHSGYMIPLATGPLGRGEWSTTASIPTGASVAYSRPPTVTGMDAGLYVSDNETSHPDADPNTPDADAPDADNLTQHTDTAFQAVMAYASDSDADASDAESYADIVGASDAEPDADNLGQPTATASQAAMAYASDSDESDPDAHNSDVPDAEPDADILGQPTVTASQAAMAWHENEDTGSSTSTPPVTTASDAANVFLDTNSDETEDEDDDSDAEDEDADYDDDDGESDGDENSDNNSPTTSQIEHPTPSRITLPRYGPQDFGYVDESWLIDEHMMMIDSTEDE